MSEAIPSLIPAAISLDRLGALVHSPALAEHLMPVETALDDIPALPLPDAAALRLSHGQAVRVLSLEEAERIYRVDALDPMTANLVALARITAGEARPVRVFNLEG